MIKFLPTKEQKESLNVFEIEQILKISAKAGTGKTSTLKFIAESHPELTFLYVAFNKSMANDAARKFPDNVHVMTIHSLAYRNIGKHYAHKLTRPTGRYINMAGTGSEIAQHYGIFDMKDHNGAVLTKNYLGLIVKDTVNTFERSDKDKIAESHIPKFHMDDIKRRFALKESKVKKEILSVAKKLWEDRCDKEERILCTHDTYLKLYQMSKPKFETYDCVLIDEAQDTSDVMISLFSNIKPKIVYVGDKHQCVSGETVLETPHGNKLMQDLSIGDEVKSYRNGQQVYRRVLNKTLSNRTEGLSVATRNGNILDMTLNHKIWATSFNLQEKQMIVYLMWRKDLGFRVGITNKIKDSYGNISFGQRTLHERAQKFWILDVVANREEALEKELTYSLRYGIPMCVYEAKSRGLNQDRINNIFKIFGKNGFILLSEKDYSFEYPHWHNINSRVVNRKMLTVHLTAHGVKGSQVSFEWTEEDMPITSTLEDAGIKVTHAKKSGRFRVRKWFSSYIEALEFSNDICDLVPYASITERLGYTSEHKLNLLPAACLFEGMSVLIDDGCGNTVIDEIISITPHKGEYFDVEVEDTANFFGNGILSHNCIYGWRGSVNAMEKINAPEVKLTQSFRFGKDIADVAKLIIDEEVTGLESIKSIVGEIDPNKPYTVLYRKNVTLIFEALEMIARGEKIFLNIDVRDFVSMLESALHLHNKQIKKVKHELIVPYATWGDLVNEAQSDPSMGKLVKIVQEGRAQEVINNLNFSEKSEATADVILTTSHKAKGLEWDQVVLADDFKSCYDNKGKLQKVDQEEDNLLYVACTRARKVLKPNSVVQEKFTLKGIPINYKITHFGVGESESVEQFFHESFENSENFQEAHDKWLDDEYCDAMAEDAGDTSEFCGELKLMPDLKRLRDKLIKGR